MNPLQHLEEQHKATQHPAQTLASSPRLGLRLAKPAQIQLETAQAVQENIQHNAGPPGALRQIQSANQFHMKAESLYPPEPSQVSPSSNSCEVMTEKYLFQVFL